MARRMAPEERRRVITGALKVALREMAKLPTLVGRASERILSLTSSGTQRSVGGDVK